jgi:hypothetical protein
MIALELNNDGFSVGERAREEVDRMLALPGEARPGDQAPPERG